MPQRTAETRFTAPTPMMAPVIVCVVLTGIFRISVMKSVSAPAVSADTPSSAETLVILLPMVLTMRQPPIMVPMPIAAKQVSGTQSGMDSTVLLITMDLPSMASRLGELEQVSLDEYGNASWSQAEGAGYYEVCVIRNATIVGGTQTVEGTSLNVGNLMTVPSNYTVKVRPVNKSDWNIKGRWVKSDSVYIDGIRAKEFKENGGVAAGQWLQDAQGWWFRNSDGSYTTENWQLIGGKWYYFDASGYMKANQWILTNGLYYYVGQDGAMLTDTYVPGTQYYVDSTGKWVE